MVAWPALRELKQVLDVSSEDWDDTLDRVLASAIAQVKEDVGHWDDYEDEPDDKLAGAALRMAELLATRPELTAAAQAKDPTYLRLMKGRRRVFGVA